MTELPPTNVRCPECGGSGTWPHKKGEPGEPFHLRGCPYAAPRERARADVARTKRRILGAVFTLAGVGMVVALVFAALVSWPALVCAAAAYLSGVFTVLPLLASATDHDLD